MPAARFARKVWQVFGDGLQLPVGHPGNPDTVNLGGSNQTYTAAGQDQPVYVLEVSNDTSTAELQGVDGLPNTPILIVRGGSTTSQNITLAHNHGGAADFIMGGGDDTAADAAVINAQDEGMMFWKDAAGEWRNVESLNESAT